MISDKKSFAFTLAETLITLTIIGVVMALMLKSVNRVNPDKDKILFLKTYHAMETVMADVINDPTKYDQTFYTDDEINALPNDQKGNLHIDFRYAPLATAQVTYQSGGASVTKKNLSRDNAMCYFLADQLNTIGSVDCETAHAQNMKLTTGACIRNLVGVDASGFNDPVIDPGCKGTYETYYVVNIYRDGKMTVPQNNANVKNQAKAYGWMQDQTKVK